MFIHRFTATLLAAVLSTAASAGTFDFSFSNVDGLTPGTVSGTVTLPDGDGTFGATDILIDMFPPSLGYGGPIVLADFSIILENSFTVAGGVVNPLVGGFFGIFPGDSSAFALFSDGGPSAPFSAPGDSSFLDLQPADFFGADGVGDTNSATVVLSPVTPTPIPLPAPALLLIGGLSGLGLMRRARC